MTAWTGTLPSLLGLEVPSATNWQEITGALEALTGAWTSYTPTWTASSSNPAIGNGTISATYMQSGKLVIYAGRILAGSTTTFGSGNWMVTLPVSTGNVNGGAGAAVAYDSGTAANRCAAVGWINNSTTLRFDAVGGDISASVPFTWASGDQLRWTYIYEAA